MVGPAVAGTYDVQVLSAHTNQNSVIQPQQSPIIALVTVHTLDSNPATGVCKINASDFGLPQFGSVCAIAAYGASLTPSAGTLVLGRAAFAAQGTLQPDSQEDAQSVDISFLYPSTDSVLNNGWEVALTLDGDAWIILLIT